MNSVTAIIQIEYAYVIELYALFAEHTLLTATKVLCRKIQLLIIF